MKRILTLLLGTAFLFSCSKKKDDNTGPSSADASWKLGQYTYVRGTSSQSSTTSSGKTITAMAVSTTGDGGNFGAFSGSALTFTFYSNLGEGEYRLGTTEMMVASPHTRIIVINCTIGTAVNTGSLLYSVLGTGGTASVTQDSNGKYHVSVSTPVTFKKDIAVNGGIPAAQETYDLTIKNAY